MATRKTLIRDFYPLHSMKDQTSLDILLATYNAEPFILEWLESIHAPSGLRVRLLVRDDQSDDATLSIIQQYCMRTQLTLKVIEDDLGRLGACGNFSELLRHADADYMMLADQDDIWLANKINDSLAEIMQLEAEDTKRPCLIFSDMKVVNQHLHTIAPSYWAYEKLSPEFAHELQNLLVQNVAAGCTMTFNRALLHKASPPLPKNIIMHDWWLMLVAATFGTLGYLKQPTVLYRQHDRNVIGAKPFSLLPFAKRLKHTYARSKESLKNTQNQAAVFLDTFQQDVSEKERDLIAQFACLDSKNPFLARHWMLKQGIKKTNLIRTLGLYALV